MRFVLLTIVILSFNLIAIAQKPQPEEPAEITSEDFGRTRDLLNDGKSVFVFRKPSYRLKRTIPRPKKVPVAHNGTKNVTAKSEYKLPVDTKSPEAWEKIGITFWRLTTDAKKALDENQTARMLVQESGASKEYTPQRVAADTVFSRGDKVRLSIESPRSGYLYIVDREIYADGRLGEPMQIFPTMMARRGNNLIQPGWIADVPAQTDQTPYFTLKSDNPNWRGELLTVILSPEPLSDMGMPDKPSPISAAFVKALEDKYQRDTTEYEQQGTEGKSYTKAEKEAGGDNKRQLTQDDPFPQTVYRVKVRPKEPMMINLNLKVK